MHVHPEIAALRGDPASQRRIARQMSSRSEAWKRMPEIARLAADLEAYGAGADLADCGVLAGMFADLSCAKGIVAGWLSSMIAGLRAERLGEVPHRYRVSPGLASQQLLRSGRATISLLAYEKRDGTAPAPSTVLFQDQELHEIVLAGSARGTIHRRGEDGPIVTRQCRWQAGERMRCPDRNHARQVIEVEGTMLLLQLARLPAIPKPTQEHRLADGALVRSASGDKSASQRLMALAVLGALDHAPALLTFEARALDPGEDNEVRWEAVRQALAMEASAGLALLERLSADTSDPLARPAANLRRQLDAQAKKAA